MRFLWLALLAACAAPVSSLEDADALRRAGRLGEAYSAYAAALCATPNLEQARKLGETWAALGQPGRLITRVETCGLPTGVVAYLDGLAAGARGDAAAAEQHFLRARALLGPEVEAELAYRRGLAWLAVGQAPLARDPLERAAALAPERVDARLALAQAQSEQGEPSTAATTLAGILAVSPTQAELARARRILAAAVRRAEPPLAGAAEEELARLLAKLERGEVSDGELAAATALARSHAHPRVLTVAGLVAWRRGMEREATQLLAEAARLNPLDGEPQRVLGAAHYTAQRSRETLAPLKESLRRNPFDSEVARMLAASATTEGDVETAAAAYRRLTVLEPSVAEHHLWLARSERRLGRVREARSAAARGTELKRDNVPLWVELASLEAQLAREAPSAGERRDAYQRSQLALGRLAALAPSHPASAAITRELDAPR